MAGFIIAGVTRRRTGFLERGGLHDVLGADGVVPATDRVFGALDDAVGAGPGVDRGAPADFHVAVIQIA